MTCREARREIGQTVHCGTRPEAELAGHLKSCHSCEGAWEIRQDLNRHLGVLRHAAAAHPARAAGRAELLREFAARYQRRPLQFRAQRWAWPAAMAAGVILMVAVAPRAASLWNSARPAEVEEVSSGRGNTDGQEGFIAVPYAPPLASGELLRVLRTELYPAALESLGVDIDPAWTGKMPAELLVGEDGYPRAVRVSAEADYVF